jgi:hypothetical protein
MRRSRFFWLAAPGGLLVVVVDDGELSDRFQSLPSSANPQLIQSHFLLNPPTHQLPLHSTSFLGGNGMKMNDHFSFRI